MNLVTSDKSAFSIPHSAFAMHTIRLRGPWEQESLAGELVRWTRRFHKPTGLDDNSRVWLVIENVAGEIDVTLNGRPMHLADSAAMAPTRLEITALLQSHNVLSLTLAAAGAITPVRLEIEDAAGD